MNPQMVGVSVNVQLWQIVLATVMACFSLIGTGYALGTIFVRRKDYMEDKKEEKQTFDELFTLLRDIKEDVDFLRGKGEK